MTRIPRVQELVEEYCGKPGNKSVNPYEAVAMGAAIQAEVLQGQIGGIAILDVTSLSLGFEILGGVFTSIIKRNTTIPYFHDPLIISTVKDNQTNIEIKVFQGENKMTKDNKFVGIFDLIGIQPEPKGTRNLVATFHIDENGLAHIFSEDQDTEKNLNVIVKSPGGLSKMDIEEMTKDAKILRAEDEKRRKAIDTKNEADKTIYNIEKIIYENKEKITENVKNDIAQAISDLKEKMNEDDVEGIEQELTRLRIYHQQLQQGDQTNQNNDDNKHMKE